MDVLLVFVFCFCTVRLFLKYIWHLFTLLKIAWFDILGQFYGFELFDSLDVLTDWFSLTAFDVLINSYFMTVLDVLFVFDIFCTASCLTHVRPVPFLTYWQLLMFCISSKLSKRIPLKSPSNKLCTWKLQCCHSCAVLQFLTFQQFGRLVAP